MSQEKRAEQVTVKLDPELRATLERAAQAEHRTLSGQVRHLVAQALKNEPRQAAQHEVIA